MGKAERFKKDELIEQPILYVKDSFVKKSAPKTIISKKT